MARLPSVRRPNSFFDVFTVTAVSITAIAILITVWRGSFVRIEMGALTAIVFVWVVWAVNRVLRESVREENQTRGDSKR